MSISNNNYKSCPLKKRPIIYVREEFQQRTISPSPIIREEDEYLPQDLSLKRKAAESVQTEYEMPPAKRECALNLSKSAIEYSPIASPLALMNVAQSSSVMMSPSADDSIDDYSTTNIHMRGLNAASAQYTTTTTTTTSNNVINPYHTAFVMAAGCNPMTSLWSTPYPGTNIYPSPASSVASDVASPLLYGIQSSTYHHHQHMTPPLSPGSEYASSEPEDLSMRTDIPLPALLHLFEEAPSRCSPASSASSEGSIVTNSSDASPSLMSRLVKNNCRFKCDKCTKMYSTSIGLSKHQQFHCPAAECNQEKKLHGCEECGKKYTTIGALKMHIRTHTLPCKCPVCGKAFSRPWLLQGHIRTHTGEKPFHCPDCPRSFADRSNLRAHQQTHVDVKKYACKICHKSFSRMSLLNKHVSSNCTITIA